MIVLSFLGFVAAFALNFFYPDVPLFICAILSSVWMVGGIIVWAIGVVGTYVGKTYQESKGRPRYFVREFLNEN